MLCLYFDDVSAHFFIAHLENDTGKFLFLKAVDVLSDHWKDRKMTKDKRKHAVGKALAFTEWMHIPLFYEPVLPSTGWQPEIMVCNDTHLWGSWAALKCLQTKLSPTYYHFLKPIPLISPATTMNCLCTLDYNWDISKMLTEIWQQMSPFKLKALRLSLVWETKCVSALRENETPPCLESGGPSEQHPPQARWWRVCTR